VCVGGGGQEGSVCGGGEGGQAGGGGGGGGGRGGAGGGGGGGGAGGGDMDAASVQYCTQGMLVNVVDLYSTVMGMDAVSVYSTVYKCSGRRPAGGRRGG
jgi:hypothetical protein